MAMAVPATPARTARREDEAGEDGSCLSLRAKSGRGPSTPDGRARRSSGSVTSVTSTGAQARRNAVGHGTARGRKAISDTPPSTPSIEESSSAFSDDASPGPAR